MMKSIKPKLNKLRSAYNIQSGLDFASALSDEWSRNNKTDPESLAANILTDIFSGIRDGDLYLSPCNSGVAWKLLRESFVGLKSHKGEFALEEFNRACRKAWREVHGEKLNSGYLQIQSEKAKVKKATDKTNIPPTIKSILADAKKLPKGEILKLIAELAKIA